MVVSGVLEPQAGPWEWGGRQWLSKVPSSLIRQGGASTQSKPELAEMSVPEALMMAHNQPDVLIGWMWTG